MRGENRRGQHVGHSEEECQRLGIEMIPLKVHFGEETYLDGVNIGPGNFYDMLEASPVMPTTSQPSPNDFLELYKRNSPGRNPGAQIISFHLSSEFSGTYQSAVIAKSMLEGEHDITVVDSRSASYGFGAAALLGPRSWPGRASKGADCGGGRSDAQGNAHLFPRRHA